MTSLMKITDSQMTKIYKLLDDNLKKRGLESLQDVVEVYNALVSAVKIHETEPDKSADSSSEDWHPSSSEVEEQDAK